MRRSEGDRQRRPVPRPCRRLPSKERATQPLFTSSLSLFFRGGVSDEPRVVVTLLDMKEQSLAIARSRARAAGLLTPGDPEGGNDRLRIRCERLEVWA